MADRPIPEPSELQELLDLAPVAVIVRAFGTDEIIFWRRGAQELYGWTPEEALGQVSHELLQTRFPISKEAVDATLRSTGHWAGELTHTRKDGEAVVVTSRQAIQRDASGRPSVTLEINSDITERKNAEERFRLLVSAGRRRATRR